MGIARREFIKRSLAGVAAAGLSGSRLAAADATKNETGAFKPFCFCVVADSHCSEGPKEEIEGLGGGVAKFLRCFEVMEQLDASERPEFILLAGDVHPWALEGRESEITIPTYAVAGNHESSREKRQQLRQVFGRGFERDGQESDYYSFVHKGIRFVAVCDAGAGGDHVGHFCSELIKPSGQCEWLVDQLMQPERTILFAHIPPERTGEDRNMYMARNDSRWFCDLVRETGPEAMFFGHLHKPTEEYAIGETRGFNVRSCCWNFGGAPLGFLHVKATADGLTVREVETGHYEA